MDIKEFWDAVLRQDANAIREYFHGENHLDKSPLSNIYQIAVKDFR